MIKFCSHFFILIDFCFSMCRYRGDCYDSGIIRWRKCMLPISFSASNINHVFNWQAFFWVILWANGDRSKKSATWVFFTSNPFSFNRVDFSRKWWILGDFGDPLSTIFAVAAGKEIGLSRNSPVQSLIWFHFFWSWFI